MVRSLSSLPSSVPSLTDPARPQVVIRGTKAFIDGQSKEYSDLEVLQMIGRAGRPQFDTTGIGEPRFSLLQVLARADLTRTSVNSMHHDREGARGQVQQPSQRPGAPLAFSRIYVGAS